MEHGDEELLTVKLVVGDVDNDVDAVTDTDDEDDGALVDEVDVECVNVAQPLTESNGVGLGKTLSDADTLAVAHSLVESVSVDDVDGERDGDG